MDDGSFYTIDNVAGTDPDGRDSEFSVQANSGPGIIDREPGS